MFPALAAAAPDLDPVLQRLAAEHEVIADVLDRALVLLVIEGQVENSTAAAPRSDGPAEIARLAAELSDLLLSHLAYEEDELAQGLGLLTGLI